MKRPPITDVEVLQKVEYDGEVPHVAWVGRGEPLRRWRWSLGSATNLFMDGSTRETGVAPYGIRAYLVPCSGCSPTATPFR